jgi:hypothetical protein
MKKHLERDCPLEGSATFNPHTRNLKALLKMVSLKKIKTRNGKLEGSYFSILEQYFY